MAGNSIYYRKLCQRVSQLQAEYLPVINPLGTYSKKEQDDTRAYSLLVHAEIEAYLETISWDKVHNALSKWTANNKYNSQILLSLACFVDQSQRIKSANTKEDKLSLIVGSYRVSLRDNNGIKESNVHNIVLPIGIAESALDATLMNTLNSFGTVRGAFAHTGAAIGTITVPDPSSVKTDVENILLALKDLDIEIKSLR